VQFYGELKKREIYSFGKFNCSMITPPLTMTKEEWDWALERIDAAVTAFEAGL
jgi:4-aminobutyrate aminotransferase-like enzyme